MRAAVIIAEYNPFHRGHEYQIGELRRTLGNAPIAVIMSGCFTQRGDPALLPKQVRAAAAIEAGADLVLELPYPYCAAGGEHFARAGVRIAQKIAPDGYLAFGSECGDYESLQTAAARLDALDFSAALAQRDDCEPHAAARSRLYRERFGDGAELLRRPNNILAIEYLRALSREGSTLEPYTVKRQGGEYDSTDSTVSFPSAAALRAALSRGEQEAFMEGVPAGARSRYATAISAGEVSYGWGRLSGALLAFFRLTDSKEYAGAAEMTGGLENRFAACASTATDADEFFALAATKRYTNARLRRAALSAMLGVTEADIKAPPTGALLLAANARGTGILRTVTQSDDFSVITKPSEITRLGRIGELTLRAQALYSLATENRRGALDFMRISPTII